MLGYRQNVISENIFPIFVGGVLSILIHVGLIYFFVVLFPAGREFSGFLICLVAFFIPAMTGGFATTFFFAKSKLIHSIVTAVVFIAGMVIPEISDALLKPGYSKQVDFFFFEICLVIILAAISGGYIGILVKRKKPIP